MNEATDVQPVRRRPLAALAALVTLAAGLLLPAVAPPAPAAGSGGDASPRALIVGVSAHSGKTKPTVGSAGDAADMAEALRRGGFRDENMMILTGHNATAANIRAGFAWLRDNSVDGGFYVFHYSGHVKQIGGDPDRDGEKLDEFLWPSDNRFISDLEVVNQLSGVRGSLWTNISGCEAAGFNDGGRLAAPNKLFTASSAEAEKSYESPDWQRSVYVKYMVSESLLGNVGDNNRDGAVSLQEAWYYAAERAPRYTHSQKNGPQHPHMYGAESGEWFLVPPPPPPPPPQPQQAPPPQEEPKPRCYLGYGICPRFLP